MTDRSRVSVIVCPIGGLSLLPIAYEWEMADSLTTVRLMAQFQSGDASAAAEIYRRYAPRLMRIADRLIGSRIGQRADADDALQSAFRTFFVRVLNGQFGVSQAGQLWRLLSTIVQHKVQRLVERHTAARRDVGREELAPLSGAVASTDDVPESALLLDEEVQSLLKRLPTRDGEMLCLALAGVPYSEIAAEIACSVHTVRRVMNRCGDLLAARLGLSRKCEQLT